MQENVGRIHQIYIKILNLAKLHKELSLLICAATVSLCIGVVKTLLTTNHQTPEATAESFDTYIPEGFSLVPIEVSNYETLDSLLGSFGVVDIFTLEPGNPERSKRIAYRVKIVRAPRNPSHFAVLVPFNEVQNILKYTGPFMVSVQNPKTHGTVIEKDKVQKRSRIVFNTGE